MKIFYHGSNAKLKINYPLKANNDYTSKNEIEIEDLFDRVKPDNKLSRRKSVFLVDDIEDVDNVGGYTDVIYSVDTKDNLVEKSDLAWYTEAYKFLEIGSIKNAEKCAEKYWSGEQFYKTDDSVFEYRVPECIVTNIIELNISEEDLVPFNINDKNINSYFMHISSWDLEEYNIDDFFIDSIYEQMDSVIKDSGIGITSDRELDLVLFDQHTNKIVALAWTSFCTSEENYEFDIIVSNDYQSMGIGKILTKEYIDKFDEYKDIYENSTMNIHVVNDNMKSILESQNFKVSQKLGDDNHIMSQHSKKEKKNKINI